MDWIFEGIGTAIISIILGLLVGGSVGYNIGIKKTYNQKQKAGKNSNQSQVGEINDR